MDDTDDFLKTGGALDGGIAQSALKEIDDSLAPGEIVARVRILEKLGTGGMGSVYRGIDEQLDRQVAVKTLHAGSRLSESQRTRLLREARILSRLDHPGINRIFDIIDHDGRPCLILEFVDGTALSELAGRLDEKQILEIGIQIAEALAAAHRQGVVHRDLKPANLMITGEGHVKILDFGIGRLIEEAHLEESASIAFDQQEPDKRHEKTTIIEQLRTKPGSIVGTPWFMSPEQAQGQPVTPASDVFSFGLTLCALATGRSPVTGTSALDALFEVAEGDFELPIEMSPSLRSLVSDLTIPDIDARPTADEAQRSMQEIIEAPLRRRRRWLLGGTAATMCAAIAIAVTVGTRFGESRYRCRDFDRHLSGIWDAERRDGLSAAFAAIGGQGALEMIVPVLNDYAQTWIDTRTEVCESTWVRGEQSPKLLDLEFACFDRRLDELNSLVSVLEENPESTRSKAVQAAHSLTPVTVCLDSQRLLDEIPLPDDEGHRTQIEGLSAKLTRIKALYDTGSYEKGFNEINDLSDAIQSVGFAPLLAEHAYLQGLLAEKRGDMELADESLQESIFAAMAGRDHRRVAEAWIRRVWIAGPILNHLDEAENHARFAEAAIQRIGPDPLLEGSLLNHRAVVADLVDDDERALDLCLQALALRRKAYGDRHPKVASTMLNCGMDLMDLEKPEEALRMIEQAFQMQLETLGPDHPAVYVTMSGLATILRKLGRQGEAHNLEQRAIALVRRHYPPDHPQLGILKSNLAHRLLNENRIEEALTLATESVATLSSSLGEMTIPTGNAVYDLARANEVLENWEEAARASDRAAEIFGTLLGAESASTIRSQALLGKALFKLGEPDRAIDVLQTAMTNVISSQPESQLRLVVQLRLGVALVTSKREPDRGATLLAEIVTNTEGVDDPWVAEVRSAAMEYVEEE